MPKLNATARMWLKGIHIVFIGAWVGAATCMLLLHFVSRPTSGDEMYAINEALKLIDDFVIIPAAIGSLLTGLLISWLTPWGFFKWRWIVVKWALTISVMLFGTFALGPWVNGMAEISAAERWQALQNPTYLHYRQMLSIFSSPQFIVLLFMVIISVLKPWGRSKGNARQA